MTGPTRVLAALIVCAVVGAACSDAPDRDRSADGTTTVVPDGTEPGPVACDDTDPAACLLPWPNDRFTRADSDTPTGRRLDLPADGMPVNARGVRIGVDEWNRSDGFSPSSIGLTVVASVDLAASRVPDQRDIAASLDQDSPLVIVDLTTGERLPGWAEVDPRVEDPSKRLVRIVPAAGLLEGHEIAIALRGLVDESGDPVPRSDATTEALAAPTATFGRILEAIGGPDAGSAGELTVAWSFTVASADGLSGRLRSMWTETSKELGDGAPPFRVGSALVRGEAKIVAGTFDMPKYLQGDGGPGSVLANDSDPNGVPTADGTMANNFLCTLPVDPGGPVPIVLYGHGLLGSRDEVLGLGTVGASAKIGFCALDFLGMSSADVPTVLDEFTDLTRFRTQPDRLQQGHLGFLLLGRLLASAKGFATDPAFQSQGVSIIDPGRLSFLGASQGGILGGAPSALASDWNRVILAVGGMGYNRLLRRSIDFDKFVTAFETNYPHRIDQALALELIQVLWDRGENSGYARHLTTDPYEGTPGPRTVLLLQAFGDHQVANVSTEKLVRTLGVKRRAPTLTPGRSTDPEPFYGIDPLKTLPWPGSGLVVWDFDTPAPPIGEVPPRAGEDPHGKLSDVPAVLAMVAAFIQPDGQIIDICGGNPCRTPA